METTQKIKDNSLIAKDLNDILNEIFFLYQETKEHRENPLCDKTAYLLRALSDEVTKLRLEMNEMSDEISALGFSTPSLPIEEEKRNFFMNRNINTKLFLSNLIYRHKKIIEKMNSLCFYTLDIEKGKIRTFLKGRLNNHLRSILRLRSLYTV